ncbi:hypothetical protein BGW42_008364 [Actinomortierella wolfii]|nr:hypothetical protein BGW42_008364 [Actinomortierella wolfii]
MADGQDQGSNRNPSPVSTSTPLNNQVRSPPVHLPSSQSTATVTAGDNMHISPLESASINLSPSHERLAAPEASVPVPRRQGSTITTSDIPSTLEQAGDEGKGPLGPLRSRIIPNHTFAEGVSTGMQAFRRTLGRVNTAISPSTSDIGEKHGSVTPGAASRTSSRHHHLHSRMPRTRPILTQFHNRDQPARMFVPPPYGQEKLQEAAKVFAEGIAKTTAMQEAAAAASSSGVFTNAPAGGAEIG